MIVPILMSQVTLTMTDGVILRWLVKEGDRVAEGQMLAEVETDKASVEIPASQEGIIVRFVAKEGDRVEIGQPIAQLEVAGEDGAAPEKPQEPAAETVPAAPVAQKQQDLPVRRRISPVAARLAREHGIDIQLLTATGPGGLIVEADVRCFLEKPAPKPDVDGDAPEETVVPMSAVRRRIAERMLLSRTATATVTTIAEVDMGAVKALRQRIPVSYTVCLIRAAALALRKFPYVNSELRGDNIILKNRVNMGVAVAVDESTLVVPVIRDADKKGLKEIAAELDSLSTSAKAGTIRPEQVTGGTFTVTNSGVWGALMFTPAINYPQAAILGSGKVMDTPVVRDGGIFVRPMMYVCLSYEHRIIDGAVAIRYLQEVKRLLEQPEGALTDETI
ncbi:MAG TPA: dihydrolipoamide acetyltransferase family protein [Chloroflexota bacterium]|nr:dihydrolipoamide acetyltransferase family protein [Chloroflexota bacterium]